METLRVVETVTKGENAQIIITIDVVEIVTERPRGIFTTVKYLTGPKYGTNSGIRRTDLTKPKKSKFYKHLK